MFHLKKGMVEIEEVKENFESMLHTEVARERIIHVVCGSKEVERVILGVCENKLKSFEDTLTIKALKTANNWKYWIPIVVALVGVVGNWIFVLSFLSKGS